MFSFSKNFYLKRKMNTVIEFRKMIRIHNVIDYNLKLFRNIEKILCFYLISSEDVKPEQRKVCEKKVS